MNRHDIGIRSTWQKRFPRLLLAFVLVSLLLGCQMGYTLKQGWRQLGLQNDQVALDDPTAIESLSETEREKLAWVPHVLEFCVNELGLDPGDSYTTLLDTRDEPISYIVTASHHLALLPYKWRFPFVGEISYKGFFDENDAKAEEERLRSEGFDTAVYPVSAYSTLGWFRDPILSTMLEMELANFIDLLIHETTHRTLYFHDDTSFNESLATFIAREGTLRFLRRHEELVGLIPAYLSQGDARSQREELMFRLKADLEALYRSPLTDEEKLRAKKDIFGTASRAYGLLTEAETGTARTLPASNALVLGVVRYHGFESFFEALQAKLGGHPRELTAYLMDLAQHGDTATKILKASPLRPGQRTPPSSDSQSADREEQP